MILENKVSVVTGGSRGIGRGISLELAKNGSSIFLVAEHEECLKETANEIRTMGVECEYLVGDISDPNISEQLFVSLQKVYNQVDILVNCAGVISRTPMSELQLLDWHRVIDVNLHGTFYVSKALLPYMVNQNSGKIINITSQMAFMPHPSASPSYEVSKAGIVALTKHMAYHYAQYNICVNSIAPGSINTDLPKSMSESARKVLEDKIPLKRLGEIDEVGKLALFLSSPSSDYITGAIFDINGGSLMR